MIRRSKGILSLFLRELKFIITDKNLVTIVFLAPLFYSFFYSSLYINKQEENVKIAVVDIDRSSTSYNFIKNIDATQLIEVSQIVNSLHEAEDLLLKMEVQGIVFIDKEFENKLKSNEGTYIKAYLNTSRFLISNDINKALNSVLLNEAAENRVKFFKIAGYNIKQAIELSDPVAFDLRSLFNNNDSYGDFIIPGLIILIIQQVLLIAIGESFAKERELNNIQKLYNKANQSISALIYGKTSFYLLMFIVYSFFFFSVHFNLFKINIQGSFLDISLITILFLFTLIFFGIFIASFFPRKILALQILAFTTYPVFFLSGYSWPFNSLPESLQYLSYLLPSTAYINAFTRTALMGGTVHNIKYEIINLIVLMIVYFCFAYYRVRKLLIKNLI